VHLKKAAAVLEFSAPVKQLGKMLGAGVHVMHNDATGELRLEPTDHAVPSAIEDDVEFIALAPSQKTGKTKRSHAVKPVIDTLPPPYKLPVADDLRNCSESWTPACIRSKSNARSDRFLLTGDIRALRRSSWNQGSKE
jgi:tripeptidyl-peptidase-1